MIHPLPTRGFNWVDASEFMPEKIDSYTNCDSKGYLLEVDVRYPKELHGLHMVFRLCAKRWKLIKLKAGSNLYGKKNCVIHIRASDQDFKHGLILEKVHRVI